MKEYGKAPLPFRGQKRNFVKYYRDFIKTLPPGVTVVDLFGGSGVLSHTAKATRPDLRVVYNDYDHFTTRLELIPQTNETLARIFEISKSEPRDKAFSKPAADKIREVLNDAKNAGFADHLTIGTSILFSGNYAADMDDLICQKTFYNKVVGVPYDAAGYLEGVEVISMDYRDAVAVFPDAFYTMDPPYLATDNTGYKAGKYWVLSDYLEIVDLARRAHNGFAYFTSSKSNLIELLGWAQKSLNCPDPFHGAQRIEIDAGINYSSRYVDYGIFKHPLI